MPRENTSLKSVDYDIEGNTIRAYYDKSHKLIFVLDETINADKPNVLLVIDSFDDRKWDDVLANDYNVDLETVRPKRDNKYQKLDIEYGGLDVYSDLIAAYGAGDDLTDVTANLIRFRAMSVRRAAKERLAAAEDTINKSHETIERTNETISELRSRVKELRSRVSSQRRDIGREPTKVSAAKILKTEAQIDAANEKLSRAKKRLTNAQRRLATAEDDAEIARAILARDLPKVPAKKSRAVATRKTTSLVAPVVVEKQDDKEQKAEEMAEDEEVKPLFDKDPENLDDDAAFKPIQFDTVEQETTETHDYTSEPNDDSSDHGIAPAPLAFTPPAQETTKIDTFETKTETTPMIDNLTSVSDNNETETVTEEKTEETVVTETFVPSEPEKPVAPVVNVRPVSPVTGNTSLVEEKSQKPTMMYYLLLVLLILLSIGTLWIYQKSTSGNIPDLAKPVTETTDTSSKPSEQVTEKYEESPFLTMQNITKETIAEEHPDVVESEPVVVEPEPVVAEPEPVAIEPEPINVEPEPVVVKSEPVEVVVESPFVTPEPIPTYEPEPAKIPSEEEVIANKPGYNVSQNDKMFVASENYDTEIVYSDDAEAAISECEGGVAPNSLGCCPGENYTYTDDGFMCCNDIECFPPAE